MKFRPDALTIDPANPFANDALERKPLVEFLAGVVMKAEGPLVIGLDSPWGTGKTTLVKMLQAHLETLQIRCIYFNAWAVDYASDPLLALVSKIDLLDKGAASDAQKRLKKLKSIATLVGKRGLIAAVKASTLGALDLEKEIEAAIAQGTGDTTSELFDLVTKEGECLSKFREELEAFVNDLHKDDKKENIVFFIDELDRCRPNFAIELLERVKHLFDVPNIIFVLSIDKTQLEVSTSSVYGIGINSREYLRRFIDLEFQVPQTTGKPFIGHLISKFGMDASFSQRVGELRADLSSFIDVFWHLSNITNLSLRTQEHCIARLALVMEQIPSNHYLHPVLAATLIVIRSINPKLYSDIRSGAASSEETMTWLNSLVGPNKLKDHLDMVIESYLSAADPNEARKSLRRLRLEALANNTAIDSGDRTYASKVLSFTGGLANSFYGAPRLDYLMNKIDLAEKLQR